jgi:hypothetical protein
VDTTRFPDAVKHKEKLYKLRNQGTAEVVFVLGEFYWRVEVGEKVLSHDFECRGFVLSREGAESEINWTLSKAIEASRIAATFGLDRALLAAALPSEPVGSEGGGYDAYVGGSSLSAKTSSLPAGILIFICALAFLGLVGQCHGGTGDDDDTASVRGGSTGGFGGK